MSTKVSITKSKLDSLANAVSVKSGTAIPLTIDEMTTAVMNISGGGSTPDLQTKSVSYTPTTSQQTAAVTADAGYDGLETVNVTISAIQTETASVTPTTSSQTITPTAGHFFDEVSVGAVSLQDDKYIAISQSGYTSFTPDNGYMGISAGNVYVPLGGSGVSTVASYSNPPEINPIGYNDQYVNIDSGFIETGKSYKVACVPFGTAGTPTATKGTVSNHQVSVTPSVTNTAGYISGGTKTGTAVTVSASELVSGTYNVTSSGTKDVTNYASASVPAGTAGTPTASKGTVSNHAISVTPSVTNTTGFITGSTKTGTAVTVSASELVSGTLSISDNGTSDCTNYASVNVNIPFVTYYTGSSDPASSLGSNGDIYLKVVS